MQKELTLMPEQKNGHSLEKPITIQGLEEFTLRIHAQPEPTSIKVNGAANNSKYLPISHIQMTLDELFMGLWNFELKSYQVVANEIIGVGILEIFHPVARTWIKRSGTGAVMIQQKKDADITDISAKYKNTLVKDFPHLESECLKSAAKKLGKIFGRDLNREFDDTYQPIYTQEAEFGDDLDEIKRKLTNCKNFDEIGLLWNSYEQFHNLSSFQKLFTAKKMQLKKK